MKKIFKAILAISIIGAMALGFAACGGNGGSDAIAVISREEGSGTRGAFVELTGVEVDKVDKTVATAEISSSTAVVMQTVAGNRAAIGYISLGSLDNTVKAVKVDGVEATADNVKNGTYPICRPFNIATKGDLSDAAKDFIAFIQSDEGQQVITDKGCVSTGSTGAFTSGNPTGTVVVEGSSSVTPVMEKLAEAYMAINSGVTVKVQQSDSSTGMTSAIEGLCDIGMASRALKEEEAAQLNGMVIANDGIAVVVERFKERPGTDLIDIDVNIYCERESHKGMVIGKGGAMLKKIASAARADCEEFLGCRVNLQCWVKVKSDWRDNEFLLNNFGFKQNSNNR